MQKVPRPLSDDDDDKFNIERVITDISALVALSQLSKERGKVSKALSASSAMLSVMSIGTNIFRYIQKKAHSGQYTLKIEEDSTLYRVAQAWLMETLPADKKLSLIMESWVSSDNDGKERKLYHRTQYDGSIEHEIEIGIHTVRVATKRPDSPDRDGTAKSKIESLSIVFTCPSAAARDLLTEELLSRGGKSITNVSGLYTVRWGSFYRTASLSGRTLDSVFLKEGQMDKIVSYLKGFLDNKDEYDKLGIPFRTGIMLYGPPGSGKTSTATVIANELNMDVYYLSIKSMTGDQEFEELVAKVPRNSIVILEDIDAVNAAKDRDGDHKTTEFVSDVSMTSLLNVLDGMQSPEGVIFVMTTNKRDRLDEAILRPGRVDLMEELSNLDTYQLKSMLRYYGGEDYDVTATPNVVEEDNITTAEVVQVVREHIPNKAAYAPELLKYVETKLLTEALK